jgi:hypothetical protein
MHARAFIVHRNDADAIELAAKPSGDLGDLIL